MPATKLASKPVKGSGRAEARIRMYRHGLGDCFLVTLPADGGRPFHLMIDCGVLLGTPDAADRMRAVVQDIVGATGGRVDALAVTHEHWDHVSGFAQAAELFSRKGERREGKLSIDELWLAWTEKPGHSLAEELKRERRDNVEKLRLAVSELRAAAGADAVLLAEGIDGVLGFFGAAGGGSTADAMKALPGLVAGRPRYCFPTHDPITPDGLSGFRIFVLGPPEDETRLRQLSSSKELYKDALAFADPGGGLGLAAPFDPQSCLPLEEVRRSIEWSSKPGRESTETARAAGDATLQFFDRHYFGKEADSPAADQAWRRIDAAWLSSAAEFALQLDSFTNNTSLVLAIEHRESEKVLLFAADAQLGNWLSWQDLEWKLDGRTVTGPDLLRRTVFYKVGHHGSHNATLKQKGLELMTSEELAAMVPVDQKMARLKNWNHMPLPALMSALEGRTQGRVIRLDRQFRPDRLSPEVRSGFHYQESDLYYDLFVPLGAEARRARKAAKGATLPASSGAG